MRHRERAEASSPSLRRQQGRWQKERRRQRMAITVGATAIVVVFSLIAYGFVTAVFLPPRRVALRVNDQAYTLGQLLKYLRAARQTAQAQGIPLSADSLALQLTRNLVENELIYQAAPRYGISVTPEEVNQQVGDNALALADPELRHLLEMDLYREKMRQYLSQDLPVRAQQIHLYQIVVDSVEKAEKVRQKFQEGTPFTELAKEFSTHKETAEKGGEVGWLPRGVLPPSVEDILWNLEAGELSPPQELGGGVYLFWVKEIEEDRAITEEQRAILQDRALQEWLQKELEASKVRWPDREDYAWLLEQL